MKEKDKNTIDTAVNDTAVETGASKDACGQRGCFSYQDGHCGCLSDTDFGGRACPFFKTVRQYEKELRSYPMIEKHMQEYGEEDDFLSANRDLIDELVSIEEEAERIEREGYEDDPEGSSDDDDWDDDDEYTGDEGGGGNGEHDG